MICHREPSAARWGYGECGGDRDCFDLCEDDNRGQWCHTKKYGEACYLNKDVLMHCDEGGDRPVAPMLHSRQAGTLNTCFRSMEDAAASEGGQLALVFMGDSVTRGMSHQTIRWLDGGSWSPRWGAPPELLKSILVKANHSAALLSLTLSGMYSKPIRGMLNLPQFLDSMKKQMEGTLLS